MLLPKTNLLAPGRFNTILGSPRGGTTRIFLSWAAVAVVFGVSFLYGRLTYSGTTPFGLERLKEMPVIREMSHLISSPDRRLVGEGEDRINILLLGMGGEGHDGANLTDTIIVASIRPSDKQVALLSVPRDLMVPLPNNGWRKINSANAFGEVKERGHGGEAARSVVEGLLGIDVPYYVRLDFNGFKEVIDGVGGVDVDVERSFKDYTYPTEDYKIQTIAFEKGLQHMDGEAALQYARSRHGTNGEGSDFARSRRQQKVLLALREKAMSAKMLRNPAAIADTLAALRANVNTNLQIGEILRLAKIAQDIDPTAIRHKVLDDGPDSPLVSGNYGGAYVLLPRGNDWSAVRDVAKNLFTEAEPSAPAAPATKIDAADGESSSDVASIPAKIEILNGAGVSGGARLVAQAAANAGFTVSKIANADNFNYASTVIYDLTKGRRAKDLARLKEAVDAAKIIRGLPKAGAGEDTDFVVILGNE
jgi:LCP family protein required for cell wall assembly